MYGDAFIVRWQRALNICKLARQVAAVEASSAALLSLAHVR